MRQSRLAIASAFGLVFLLMLQRIQTPDDAASYADEQPKVKKRIEQQQPAGKVIGIPINAADRRKSMMPYMHAKVGHSQKVFEGLVTKDFDKIEAGAEALMLTSLNTPGVEPDDKRNDEVFKHLKLEFVRLSGRLKQVAADENLEGAAYVTEKLNATCIACHQYLRDELPRAVRPAH